MADSGKPGNSHSSPYVQFGCGLCVPPAWRNFDAGPAFWLQKNVPFLKPLLVRRGFPDYPRQIEYGDIVKGLPVAAGTARAVYSSHVLEHLSLHDFRAAIRNVYAMLQPGGKFRSVLPDLEGLVTAYTADRSDDAALQFMTASLLGEQERVHGAAGLGRMLFGRSRHLWMWDYKALAKELRDTGFVHVRRASIGDSAEPRFKDVEDPGRWTECLGVECEKPALP